MKNSQIAIYVAGNIQKGHEKESEIFCTLNFLGVLGRKARACLKSCFVFILMGGTSLLYANHYTIVLTPPADQTAKYIEVSQALYSQYQPQYLLNAYGTSSPHITVVQFDCDSPSLAQEIWKSMCEKMAEEKFETFAPLFAGVSFIEGVGLYEGTTWVELAVKRGDKTSPIMKVHHTAVNVLKTFGLTPLNASCSDYRPHLTLARIVMPKQMEVWSKNLCENPGNFRLEFGLSDEHWQYARTFSIFPPLKSGI